ncbi:MAG TPA: hypothetical protein DEA47_06015 [Peptococcaceae bacterium]|nr:MAG: hypothetical protein XD50_0890 [Clostridia bacterium 41_269]HBT20897.1 hypothetical protein [Peptococcaceae bacterium]
MSQDEKRKEIRQFKSAADDEDFNRLIQKIKSGELKIAMTRDKSRNILRQFDKKFYYLYFICVLAAAAVTIYFISIGRLYISLTALAVTLMLFFAFWSLITRRAFNWAIKKKKNFDYAYYITAVTIKKDSKEYKYPHHHWKDAL